MTDTTSAKSNSNLFRLVYEGPVDDSPRTLQKIKGVFVADLEFPIPQIQAILNSAPVTIIDADNESELRRPYKLLKKAGARVLIIGPQLEIQTPGQEPETGKTNSLDDFSRQPLTTPDNPGGESDELAFELVVDGLETASGPAGAKESGTKIYTLDIDSTREGLCLPADNQSTPSPSELSATSLSETSDAPATSANPLLSMLETKEAEVFLFKKETPSNETEAQEQNPLSLEDAAEDPAGHAVDADSERQKNLNQFQTPRLAEFETFALELEDTSPKAVPDPLPLNEDTPRTPIENPLSDLPLEIEESSSESNSRGTPRAQSTTVSDTTGSGTSLPPQLAELTLESSPANRPVFQPLTEPEPKSSSQEDIFTGTTPKSEPPPPAPPASEAPAECPQEDMHSAKSNAPTGGIRFNKKHSQRPEIILPILLGSIILTVANWYYFSPTAELPLLADLPSLEEGTGTPANPAGGKLDKPDPATDIKTLEVTDSTQERELKASFLLKNGQIVSASVNISTTPPAELTKEELVAGKKRAPWLRKVQALNIPLKQTANSEYAGQGAALAYIERNGRKLRIAGTAEITARILDEGQTISALITTRSKDLTVTPEQSFKFESTDNESFAFYVSSEITAKQEK